jgi:hypothetical protein
MSGVQHSSTASRERVTLTAAASPHYIELPSMKFPLAGIFLRWHDATSEFTVALHSTNLPREGPEKAAEDDDETTDTDLWYVETGVVIAGNPAAGAKGCEMVHVADLGSARNRLKISCTADTVLSVWLHAKQG